jgi:hypothetical protein
MVDASGIADWEGGLSSGRAPIVVGSRSLIVGLAGAARASRRRYHGLNTPFGKGFLSNRLFEKTWGACTG